MKYTLLFSIKWFFIVLVIGLPEFACRKSVRPIPGTTTYHVNLERDISNISSLPISYLGSSLEYIPLETNPFCLIREIQKVSVLDSFVFVSDQNRLLLFDRSGNFVRQIGSEGRGPGEYQRIYDFGVDLNSKEIIILTVREILVYDFSGEFKRQFGLGFSSSQFVLDESFDLVLNPLNLPKSNGSPSYCLYIFNKYGKVKTKIPITLKRFNEYLAIQISPLYMYDNTLHFMEFGIDTLFSYKENIKKPHIIFNYGNLKIPTDPKMDELFKADGKFYVCNVMETQKSIFIRIWYLFPRTFKSNCVFDKSTLKFTVLKENNFSNDIDEGVSFWPRSITNDSLLVDFVDAYDLAMSSHAINNESISSQPVKIERDIKKLKETSNPVIMILHP